MTFSYHFRSLLARPAETLTLILAFGVVAFVIAGGQMLLAGLQHASRGDTRNVMVLQVGASTEYLSSLGEESARRVTNLSEMVDRENASEELVIVVLLDAGGGETRNVVIRGITPRGHTLRPQFKLVQGRLPAPGTREVIVGRSLARSSGLTTGGKVALTRGLQFDIVGTFDVNSVEDSEIWMDLPSAQDLFYRKGLLSTLRIRPRPGAEASFRKTVEQAKGFGYQVVPEPTYNAMQSEGIRGALGVLALMISLLASGSVIIALISAMYSAIDSRQREIGTLRALGFKSEAVLFGFLFEALFVAVIGSVVGALGSVALSAAELSIQNQATWSELVIPFRWNPAISVVVIVVCSVGGTIGGLLPAIRALRILPQQALRS